MNTPLRLALATLAAALSPLAFAHASLVDSFPAKGQTLTGSPAEIHLTFNEHVEARYCRIKLRSDAGKNFDADRPTADKANPNAIVAKPMSNTALAAVRDATSVASSMPARGRHLATVNEKSPCVLWPSPPTAVQRAL